MNIQIDKLKYPIGPFKAPDQYTVAYLKECFDEIRSFPDKLKKEVSHLSNEQLDTPYRDGGWTIRQVIHHLADSHMNGFTRLKLALCEDKPVIKPYPQDEFVKLADSKTMAIEPSLMILEGIHARWYELMLHMSASDFDKVYVHPEYMKEYSTKEFIALYKWHGSQHLAHITGLKERMGWK